MTTAMRRKEDLEEQKEAMLPTLRSKLLAPTDVEEANDRLRRFLLWQALNGVAVMTYYVVRSLYVTRIAGDNPVSGSNLALREAVVATIASVVGANFVPPCADNPRVGRKPLLLLLVRVVRGRRGRLLPVRARWVSAGYKFDFPKAVELALRGKRQLARGGR